jgi:MFS family permease
MRRYFSQFSRNARLFLLAVVIDGVALSGLQLFLNLYLRSRGLGLDFIGLLNALPSGAGLVVGVPVGYLSDRLGRRPAMLLGLGVSTLAACVMVTATSPALMALAACAKGTGDMLFMLSLAPFMMHASGQKERTLLFSLSWGLQTISGAAGDLLAGQLPGWFGAWLGVGADSATAYRAVLVAGVVTGGLALIPLWLISEQRQLEPRLAPAGGWASLRLLVRPATLRLAAPNFIISLGAAILVPYMNLFFRGRYLTPDASLGVLFSLSSALIGVGALMGPPLAVRLGGKIKAVVVTQGMSVIFLLVLGFVSNFWLAAAAFLLRAALMNMAAPLYSAFVMEHAAERERGAVNSVMQTVWNVGWAVGPYVSGAVQQQWGFTPLFVATAILYAGAIGLTWRLFHAAEAQTQPAAPAVALQP